MKANCHKFSFQLAVLREELQLERKLVSDAIEKDRSMTSKRDDGECYFFMSTKKYISSMQWLKVSIKCINVNA